MRQHAKETRPQRRPLSRSLLSDQAYNAVRDDILRGVLAPGDRLVETDIAGSLSVSQATVREALKRLAHEGLVLQLPRRGSYVASISVDEARRTYAVREPLEGMAARDFCEFASDDDVTRLTDLVDDMHRCADAGDLRALIDTDMEFHRTVWEAGQNPLLPRVWPMVETVVRGLTLISNELYFDPHEVAASHLPLLESLRDRDPERATAHAVEHVNTVWQRIAAGELNPTNESES